MSSARWSLSSRSAVYADLSDNRQREDVVRALRRGFDLSRNIKIKSFYSFF